MKLVDVNLLVYAVNRDAPDHRKAKRWFERAVVDSETIGIAWIVVLAFLRITTRPGILQHPLGQEDAIGYVDEWLALPNTELVVPGDAHWRILSRLLRSSGTLGNLTSDAHLAALALEHGAVIYSADYDFQRFQGIKHVNPLQ